MKECRALEIANLMVDILLKKAGGSHAKVIDELMACGITRDELIYDLEFPLPDVESRIGVCRH